MNKKPSFFQRIIGRKEPEALVTPTQGEATTTKGEVHPLDFPPNDPLLAYLTGSSGVIEVDKLNLDSPTLRALREEGVRLALPLVSQGELIGLLNLGSRMSEQEYSSDDYRLLHTLAIQASPALRIAQLARQQLVEAQERERIENELRVARVIQQTLLPKEIPQPSGWALSAFWQPAREVGGDFYDFIVLPDGRMGILVADVTDKGVPAALVMATTRSMLRAVAERLIEPGQVLERVNNLLYPDIPQKMFVTCLYLVMDLTTGHMAYANAGHNLPYLRTSEGVIELRATGMPLGLLPEMEYEQKEMVVKPGEGLLLSSDGLVEAHNAQREMFSFPRVKRLMGEHPGGEGLVTFYMDKLAEFTGPDYEQEDDITLVTIERLPVSPSLQAERGIGGEVLGEFAIPSQPGNERQAAAKVLEAVAPLNLPESRRKRLETAVAEATMNAMEHGNKYQEDIPVKINVTADTEILTIRITDQGGGAPIPASNTPDLEAKLAGEQSPRGWGLFLIKNMVDEMNLIQDEKTHTIELKIRYTGTQDK
jgi:serine phosphatase RsbU (regulator of sigma subunit)/anti-sigma regulatory factor (Ser/Thr protein kinase)